MSKNTGDGELDEILEELASDLNAVSYNHPDFIEKGTVGAFKEAKTAIKKYAAQEANKAQRQLLKELMEQKCTAGVIEPTTGIRQDVNWLPISVIQNKLEGLS